MTSCVIRGGTLVTSEGTMEADLAIEDGRIQAIGPQLPGAREEIDAGGLHILPGVIDVHVHFNEPGRTDWEGAGTGSRALAAGGGTAFFDMPLNSTPCTTNAAEFHRKRKALESASIADFALWGGLIPGNLSDLAELAACGVIGFKAFMSNSGLPEFPRADDVTLYEGMREAARLGLPVAVHAESEEITHSLSHRMLQLGRTGVRDFLESRPVLAELEAIERAALFASEAKASLHIVHVSSGRGVVLAAEARARGVDVTIETCPHYLFFTVEDVERIGANAKCAPPVRDAADQNQLWLQIANGLVDIVASDHSPAPPEMKSGGFFQAWGGVAGVQSTLAVMLDRGYHTHGLPLDRVASLLATNPAQRFRISDKGSLGIGKHADLAIVNLTRPFTLERRHLFQRHPTSPYLGSTFRASIERTIRRGETIFHDGVIGAETRGALLRPSTT